MTEKAQSQITSLTRDLERANLSSSNCKKTTEKLRIENDKYKSDLKNEENKISSLKEELYACELEKGDLEVESYGFNDKIENFTRDLEACD